VSARRNLALTAAAGLAVCAMARHAHGWSVATDGPAPLVENAGPVDQRAPAEVR